MKKWLKCWWNGHAWGGANQYWYQPQYGMDETLRRAIGVTIIRSICGTCGKVRNQVAVGGGSPPTTSLKPDPELAALRKMAEL